MGPTSFFTLGAGASIGPYDNGHTVAGIACVFFCIMQGTGDSSGVLAGRTAKAGALTATGNINLQATNVNVVVSGAVNIT